MSNTIPVTEISKVFYARCGHKLAHLKEGHKCLNMHGEFYKITLSFVQNLKPTYMSLNMIMDFDDIKEKFKFIENEIDHAFLISKNDPHLNQIKELGLKLVILDYLPTVEYIAYWIYKKFKPIVPYLYKVTVVESKDNEASYYEIPID